VKRKGKKKNSIETENSEKEEEEESRKQENFRIPSHPLLKHTPSPPSLPSFKRTAAAAASVARYKSSGSAALIPLFVPYRTVIKQTNLTTIQQYKNTNNSLQ